MSDLKLSAEQHDAIAAYLAASGPVALKCASQAGVWKLTAQIMAAFRGNTVSPEMAELVADALNESCDESYTVTEVHGRPGTPVWAFITEAKGAFTPADLKAIKALYEEYLPESPAFQNLPEKAVRAPAVKAGKVTVDLAQVTGNEALVTGLKAWADFTEAHDIQIEIAYGVVGIKVGGRKHGQLDSDLKQIQAPEGVKVSDAWKVNAKDAKLDWQLAHFSGLTTATKNSVTKVWADRIVDLLRVGQIAQADSLALRFPDHKRLHAHMLANELVAPPALVKALNLSN